MATAISALVLDYHSVKVYNPPVPHSEILQQVESSMPGL